MPYPIERKRLADLRVLWDLNVGLAPLFKLRGWLAFKTVWEFFLTKLRNGVIVQLMASAVIEVLRGDQEAVAVATLAISSPRHNIEKLLAVRRRVRAEDEDGSAVVRLANVHPRFGDVAIFKILHCDVAAWRDLQHWVSGIGVVGRSLRRVAEEVRAVDSCTALAIRRQEVVHTEAIVARVGAGHVPSRIAIIAGELSVNDVLQLFVPRVCRSSGYEKRERERCR